MKRNTLNALLCFFASLVLAGLFMEDRLAGQKMPLVSMWALYGQSMGALCLIYFISLKQRIKYDMVILGICFGAAYLLYKNIYNCFGDYTIYHQICSGTIFICIAYFPVRMCFQVGWKNFISMSCWVSLAAYEVYNFLEFLFYKLGFEWPTPEQLLLNPNISSAMRQFGWSGHYVPQIFFWSLLIGGLFYSLWIAKRLSKIDFQPIKKDSGWWMIFKGPQNFWDWIVNGKNIIAHVSFYDSHSETLHGFKATVKNGKKSVWSGKFIEKQACIKVINRDYSGIYFNSDNSKIQRAMAVQKNRSWDLISNNCIHAANSIVWKIKEISFWQFIKQQIKV